MLDSPPKSLRYRIGPYHLDPQEGRLVRDGVRVKLQDLPFRLLVLLVERAGQIVTRDEVRQRLWPDNTFVEFDNSLGVAVRKLREALRDDAEASRFVETIPRRGYRFLAPVIVENPDQIPKPASPGESGEIALLPEMPPPMPATVTSGRRWYWAISLLALLAAGGWTIYRFGHGRLEGQPSPGSMAVVGSAQIRRSVAILGFRNLPGRAQEDWLSTAFSEMLNTELAAGGKLRLVSGEDVARAKRELRLAPEDTLAKETLAHLRNNPGADVVVLGSYTLLPGKERNRIRLDIRLQDTAAGETIAEEALTGSEENLFELASEAGVRLRQTLGVSSISEEATHAARASLPSNQAAVRLYAEGRQKLWSFDFLGARNSLLQAVTADPGYPLAHAALAEAWDRLGYTPKALAEAQRAFELSGQLSQEERLLVEGQYHKVHRDWPKAVETYRSLFRLFPDNLDYGLRLASVQRQVKTTDSLLTLATLRHLPSPAGEDPRIDLSEASAWINEDSTQAHAAAERAIAKGNAQGAHLLVARAYGILCQQGSSLGTAMMQAIAACETARQSYAAEGDSNNEARTLSDFAVVYYQRGDLGRAKGMWLEANKVFLRIGDPEGIAATLNNMGDALIAQGDLAKARTLLEQSLPEYKAIEDKDGYASVMNDLGDLAREQGDLKSAELSYQQAKTIAEEIDDKSVMAYVFAGLGDVLSDRGDLETARKSFEQALALRAQVGEQLTTAETQLKLAQLSIEQGHATEAEVAVRRCKEQFHREQQAVDELTASGILTQALLAQGKESEAKAEVALAAPLAAKNQNRLAGLQFALVSARVALASDRPQSSRPQLEQVVQGSRQHGFLQVEWESLLSLAELEKKSGHLAVAQAQSASLAKATRAKGFELIARKAELTR
jgi:DNA-binding winged helix-turn-helix (wHTH) protein/tetratricopeptide (TPR) repeat protein